MSDFSVPNAMITELDTVVMTRDLPERRIVEGDLGTVVVVYADERTLEVEFVSGDGSTVTVETLSADDVRPIAADEILHVRPLRSAV